MSRCGHPGRHKILVTDSGGKYVQCWYCDDIGYYTPGAADVDWSAARVMNQLTDRVLELEKVLRFYADPESYFAIFITADRPSGGFADDFSDVDTEDADFLFERPMPGALAREALGIELYQQRKRDYYG